MAEYAILHTLAEALQTYQIEEVDCRPWLSVRQRRRIPQPHWLFATRVSLDLFLKSIGSATAGAETRAVKHLADVLKRDRQ
jgi:hypothetical protein